MNLKGEYIIDTFLNYKKDKLIYTKQELEEKYQDFKKKYPKIYLSFVDNVFEISKFETLLNIHKESYKKTQGDHKSKKFESDTKVSEELAKEYLYPVIGEPSENQKKIAKKKAWKKANEK